MILLDGIDDKPDDRQAHKLVAEASTSVSVTYDPFLPEIKEKRTRRRRCRKYGVFALTIYFLLTVVIGIPIIVVKMKKKTAIKGNPYPPWDQSSPTVTNSITLGDAPLRLSAARSCNAWHVKDRPAGNLFLSQLNYSIPTNRSVFLNTNISYTSNAAYLNHFSGSLLVDVNDDPSVDEGIIYVSMYSTSPRLSKETNVCQMLTGQGGGLYIFTPQLLNQSDALSFNITLLLPQGNPSPSYVPQLLCHLPHFQHTYGQLDPAVAFDTVVFGGAMAGVFVQSIRASSVTIKASTAEIRGSFKVDSMLSLETVSAPIHADIHLMNNNTPRTPTYMRLTTGNNILNANVTLYVAPPSDDGHNSDSDDEQDGMIPAHGPHFIASVETFNAPLDVSITHDPSTYPVNLQMRASNNLGNTRFTVDPLYSGTFDVNTMFAQADVLTWDGSDFDAHYDDPHGDASDSDDDNYSSTNSSTSGNTRRRNLPPPPPPPPESANLDLINTVIKKGKVRMFLPNYVQSTSTTAAVTATSTNASGRCLEYDLISSSQIRGWVGVPPRPLPNPFGPKADNMSHIEVVSSLSGAQLLLHHIPDITPPRSPPL
ncbi:uncharacterized protein BXZ73DRAFT_90149 [Epithele typhae]|uniref:uncharacterized protein n=1 Tax=Epithele typhae TaxID=378194 RepID=UPI0020075D49|nr:uncharacterized protein BXZ73DRAFT_90149 [Epithele typhae]KAH9931058.1 hypothetical protein BXZ73DRAFT_90149 [Epithele typhae]